MLEACMRKRPPVPGSKAHLVWLAFKELDKYDQATIGGMAEDLAGVEGIGPSMALVIIWELGHFLVKRGVA